MWQNLLQLNQTTTNNLLVKSCLDAVNCCNCNIHYASKTFGWTSRIGLQGVAPNDVDDTSNADNNKQTYVAVDIGQLVKKSTCHVPNWLFSN